MLCAGPSGRHRARRAGSPPAAAAGVPSRSRREAEVDAGFAGADAAAASRAGTTGSPPIRPAPVLVWSEQGMTVTGSDFALPAELEAHEPPEARGLARDGVRLLVGGPRRAVSHHRFTDLPALLGPGDVLVVNTSATLPAAVPVRGGRRCTSPPSCREGAGWSSSRRNHEPRRRRAGQRIALPGGAPVTLEAPSPRGGCGSPWSTLGHGPGVPGGVRRADPVLLRAPGLAAVGLPDGVRHDAGQRRDAERAPAVHRPAGHPAGRRRACSSRRSCCTPGSPRRRRTSGPTRSGSRCPRTPPGWSTRPARPAAG